MRQNLSQILFRGSWQAFVRRHRYCGMLLRRIELLRKALLSSVVFFGIFLICYVALVYFCLLLPKTIISVPETIAEVILGIAVLALIFITYYYAVTKDPESPPLLFEVEQALKEGTFTRRYGDSLSFPLKSCEKCYRVKPPGAHHCSTCNRCILDMDHHCPWLNQCVGAGNYRYFLLLLIWLSIGSTYAMALYAPTAFPAFLGYPTVLGKNETALTLVMISFAIVLAIFLALLVLGAFHAYLLMSGRSTIDVRGGIGKYDDLGPKANRKLHALTGIYPFPFWLLPWYSIKKPSESGALELPRHVTITLKNPRREFIYGA